MSPPITAEPTIDIISPMQAPTRPFSQSPPDSAATSVRPRTASQKYSIGPKASATFGERRRQQQQRQRADQPAGDRGDAAQA